MTVHDTIENAAAIIRKGGLVAIPTETVYGLAADATNDRAVARIFEAKGRPQFCPVAHQRDAGCNKSMPVKPTNAIEPISPHIARVKS